MRGSKIEIASTLDASSRLPLKAPVFHFFRKSCPDRYGRSLDACHFLNFQRGQTFEPQKRQAPISRAKLRYSPFQIHESNVERFRLWRTDVFQSRLAGLTPPVPYLPRQSHVVGNAIEPGALTRFAKKCWERAPYAYKNFLK